MGMCIEVKATVIYTCELSDEDVSKIKKHIDSNRQDYMNGCEYSKEEICDSIDTLSSGLEIELFKDAVESDFFRDEIRWSSFEEKSVDEIFSECE